MRRIMRSRPHAGRRPRLYERGYLLVWFGVMLTMLLLFAAFAVDLGHWYLVTNRAQKAADAAATAGVVHRSLEGFPGGSRSGEDIAVDVALATAADNGFSAADGDTVDVLKPADNQLEVDISTTFDNYFLKLIGLSETTVDSEATAEYAARVDLGSYRNTFGNEPGSPAWRSGGAATDNPGWWPQVAGPRTILSHGDPFQGNECRADDTGEVSPLCLGVPDDENQPEYEENGIVYDIDVREPVDGDLLKVELYDPQFLRTGAVCGNAPAMNVLVDAIDNLQGRGDSATPPFPFNGQDDFFGTAPEGWHETSWDSFYKRALTDGFWGEAGVGDPATIRVWFLFNIFIDFFLPGGGLSDTDALAAVNALKTADREQYLAGKAGEDWCAGDDLRNAKGTCPDIYYQDCVNEYLDLFEDLCGEQNEFLCILLGLGAGGGGILPTDTGQPPSIGPPEQFAPERADPSIGPPEALGPPRPSQASDGPAASPVSTTPLIADRHGSQAVRPAAVTDDEDPTFPPMTRFTLRLPEGALDESGNPTPVTPGDPNDNPVVTNALTGGECQYTYPWFDAFNTYQERRHVGTTGDWDAVKTTTKFDTVLALWADNARWNPDNLERFPTGSGASLEQPSGPSASHATQGFRDWYHNWSRFCTVDNPQEGSYLLQVQSNQWYDDEYSFTYDRGINCGYPPDSDLAPPEWAYCERDSWAPLGAGINGYAIRAALGAWSAPGLGPQFPRDSENVSVSGDQRMSIFANLQREDTAPACTGGYWCAEFEIARVLPGSFDRTLVLQFFDAGDMYVCEQNPIDNPFNPGYLPRTACHDPVGSLSVVPPAEVGDSWSCTFTEVPEDVVADPSSCRLSELGRTTTNGQLIEARVVLDSDAYTCAESSPTGCWIRGIFSFPKTYSPARWAVNDPIDVKPTDVTGWKAWIEGDPVRIVE